MEECIAKYKSLIFADTTPSPLEINEALQIFKNIEAKGITSLKQYKDEQSQSIQHMEEERTKFLISSASSLMSIGSIINAFTAKYSQAEQELINLKEFANKEKSLLHNLGYEEVVKNSSLSLLNQINIIIDYPAELYIAVKNKSFDDVTESILYFREHIFPSLKDQVLVIQINDEINKIEKLFKEALLEDLKKSNSVQQTIKCIKILERFAYLSYDEDTINLLINIKEPIIFNTFNLAIAKCNIQKFSDIINCISAICDSYCEFASTFAMIWKVKEELCKANIYADMYLNMWLKNSMERLHGVLAEIKKHTDQKSSIILEDALTKIYSEFAKHKIDISPVLIG